MDSSRFSSVGKPLERCRLALGVQMSFLLALEVADAHLFYLWSQPSRSK